MLNLLSATILWQITAKLWRLKETNWTILALFYLCGALQSQVYIMDCMMTPDYRERIGRWYILRSFYTPS